MKYVMEQTSHNECHRARGHKSIALHPVSILINRHCSPSNTQQNDDGSIRCRSIQTEEIKDLMERVCNRMTVWVFELDACAPSVKGREKKVNDAAQAYCQGGLP